MATLVGRMLGRYRLEALLGRGGMAEVYRATDTKLARTVAVKVILPEHATDDQFVERFLREARVVASLEHPNILPVYDFGEEERAVWLVMPYMDGGTLRDRMAGGPLPLALAAAFIRQLADALDAAHAAGVLHRDVKPANVLVGKGDRLVLADFGIAKMLEAATGLTATGMVVGTPVYMAPEQAQGRPATAASDRYALGVLAYELLSGRPPFGGESALALMHQHVTAPVPALSTVVRGLPAGLDLLLDRALAKDPDERPPSCRALADAIATYVPTGAHAVFAAAAPLTPATKEVTSVTLLQEMRPPTPGAARALTSVATVATGTTSAGRGRALVLAGIGAALALGAAFVWSATRPVPPMAVAEHAPEPTPPPPPPPTVRPEPSAAAPVTVVELPPAATAAVAPAKTAALAKPNLLPASPSPTPAPIAHGLTNEEAEPEAPGSLVEAHRRLDPARQGRRPSREDFAFALAAARRAAAESPNKAEARFLEAYASAGLAFMDGREDDAARLLADAFRDGARLGNRDALRLWLLEKELGEGARPPAWALAVALGDPRRTAGPLIEKAIADRPAEAAAWLGRAVLSRLEGKSEAAASDAKTAYEKAKRPSMRATSAELAGEELAITGNHADALQWLRRAVAESPLELRGRVAARAARIARGKLSDEAAAREFLDAACRSGNTEACKETGSEEPHRGRRRLLRRSLGQTGG